MAGEAKSIIDTLWDRLWAGGIANPVTAIEQISYFMLLKRLDDRDAVRRFNEGSAFSEDPELRWGALLAMGAAERFELLRQKLVPFLADVVDGPEFERAMRNATFAIPKPSLVADCMRAIDELDAAPNELGLQGDDYEELLRQLQLSGRDGQFTTPPELIAAMVELVDPAPGAVVCDPVAGTAGFLVAAHRAAAGQLLGPPPDENFLAFDANASMVRLGMMNMIFHGIEQPRMSYTDTLSPYFEWPLVDVILANPPFGGQPPREVHPELELTTNRTELLFLELCRRLLHRDGQAAIIVPEGLLFGRSKAHVEVRRRWLRQGVRAVITLPAGLFRPYTRVRTAILLGAGSGGTEEVWFGAIGEDGYAVDDRRRGEADSDLKHLPRALRARLAGTLPQEDESRELARRMWSAPIAEIEAAGWVLSPASFPREKSGHEAEPEPLKLVQQIEESEQQFEREVKAAREVLERAP